MHRHVALLRGINVGGRARISMPALRTVCEALGWSAVETYIQSGNVVFSASGQAPDLEQALETAVAREFSIAVPILVRTAAQWPVYLAANPFAAASAAEPSRVMLCLSKAPPDGEAAEALQERARDGEQIRLAAHAVWIHYPAGAGRSRLSPTLVDRLVGSPTTARNWRTVVTLGNMLRA